RAVIAVMHTTIIRASMTAYSTAVGPSSRFRKLTTWSVNLRIGVFSIGEKKTSVSNRPDLRGGDGGVQSHVGEHLVGIVAQGRDGGDAYHNNQGEHHGVFHRGRAVFGSHE